MIEYATLADVTVQPYRSNPGAAVKLRFDRGAQGPSFGYLHRATSAEFDRWVARVGELIPIRVRKVLGPGDRWYNDVRPVLGLRR